MPKSIALFERVAYSALVLGLVSITLNWPAVRDSYNQSPTTYWSTQIGTLCGQMLLIWLIARKRRNWARWIWILVTFVGTPLGILAAATGAMPLVGLLQAISYYLLYLVSFGSACLLLTPTARAWFQVKSSEANIHQ